MPLAKAFSNHRPDVQWPVTALYVPVPCEPPQHHHHPTHEPFTAREQHDRPGCPRRRRHQRRQRSQHDHCPLTTYPLRSRKNQPHLNVFASDLLPTLSIYLYQLLVCRKRVDAPARASDERRIGDEFTGFLTNYERLVLHAFEIPQLED